MENVSKPQAVDDYIALAVPKTKEHLERLRIAILQAAPDAVECISYEMPAYKLHGIVVYFGGFSNHVSLFPGSEAIIHFKDELLDYKTSGGTIRFSLDKKIPVALVKKIVKYRVKQNLEKEKLKRTKNKKVN